VVTVPSAFFASPVFLPLVSPTRSPGTVSAIDIPSSGSSEGWSLQGHQSSPPSPWLVTPIQCAPDGVFSQTKPSFQGGRRDTFGTPA
jgi:hypothetical protein